MSVMSLTLYLAVVPQLQPPLHWYMIWVSKTILMEEILMSQSYSPALTLAQEVGQRYDQSGHLADSFVYRSN
jgi:hypothetical protein